MSLVLENLAKLHCLEQSLKSKRREIEDNLARASEDLKTLSLKALEAEGSGWHSVKHKGVLYRIRLDNSGYLIEKG